MFYTVYKITNLINGKIYIGVHKTQVIDDDYMGSGKILRYAQQKYGIENFEKEILEVFDNSEEMFEMESKLVNEDFVNRKDTYNLKEGGYGGWSQLNSDSYDNPTHSFEHMQMMSKKGRKKAQKAIYEKYGTYHPTTLPEIKEKIVNTHRERYGEDAFKTFKGKKHTEETKKKISETAKGQHVGEKNSQYGTMWIYSLKEKRSKKIKKEDLSLWESKGWIKGRKIKFL